MPPWPTWSSPRASVPRPGATSIWPISSWPRGARPRARSCPRSTPWPGRIRHRLAQTQGASVADSFTFDDLKTILVTRIGLPADQVVNDPAASFAAMGLDSLALVEIQLAVQQRYGFSVPDEDAQHIQTVGQAIEYTNRRIQE